MYPIIVRQQVLHQACYRHKHMESSQLSYEISTLISAFSSVQSLSCVRLFVTP